MTRILTITILSIMLGLLATTAQAWNINTSQSLLTDQQTVVMSVNSTEPMNCNYNGGHARLAIQCVENETSLFIETGCFMASLKHSIWGDVDYRLDKLPPKKRRFRESTGNDSLGLWGGSASIPVIKSMFGHKVFIARVTPYNKNSQTLIFSIVGIEDRIKTLRQACNW